MPTEDPGLIEAEFAYEGTSQRRGSHAKWEGQPALTSSN